MSAKLAVQSRSASLIASLSPRWPLSTGTTSAAGGEWAKFAGTGVAPDLAAGVSTSPPDKDYLSIGLDGTFFTDRRQKAAQKFAAAADQFQNLVYEQADSLQGVTKEQIGELLDARSLLSKMDTAIERQGKLLVLQAGGTISSEPPWTSS